MNKKGIETVLGVILVFIILAMLLLVSLMAYYSPKGLLTKIGNFLEEWADKIMAKIKTSDDATKNIDSSEQKLAKLYDQLTDIFETYQTQEKCFINYDTNYNDFKWEIIKITKTGQDSETQGTTFIYVDTPYIGGVRTEKIINTVTIDKVYPCVVIGTQAKSFYEDLIDNQKLCQNCYTVTDIQLLLDTTGKNELGIRYYSQNSWNLGLLSESNILYKPDKNHICFFPIQKDFVNPFCNIREMLDDDCINNIKKQAKPLC